VDEVPSELVLIAKANRYGVFGLEWTDKDTLIYQEGLQLKQLNLGNSKTSFIQSIRSTRSKEVHTFGTLPTIWRRIINNLDDITFDSAEEAKDLVDTLSLPDSYYNTSLIGGPPKFEGGGEFNDDNNNDDDNDNDDNDNDGGFVQSMD
jgi:hypothetical protein